MRMRQLRAPGATQRQRATATRLSGGNVARLRLAPRVALHVLVCSAQQRRISQQRAHARKAGHALNTMMGCPPIAILDDGAGRVVTRALTDPFRLRRESARRPPSAFSPPGISHVSTRALRSGARDVSGDAVAARRGDAAHASRFRRRRPGCLRALARLGGAAGVSRGCARARARDSASRQPPCPPRCRWLTSRAAEKSLQRTTPHRHLRRRSRAAPGRR